MSLPLQRLWLLRRITVSVSGDKGTINVLGRIGRHNACPHAHEIRQDVCAVIAGWMAVDEPGRAIASTRLRLHTWPRTLAASGQAGGETGWSP
jgi:hypothetical protein